MANEDTPPVDHYAAVLADLYQQRDKIGQAIAVLEALRGGSPSPHAAPQTSSSQNDAPAPRGGDFLGMTIVDATRKLLSMRREAMGNAAILADLKRGGLVLTSSDPMNVVNSVLTRRFNQVGDVVRVARGVWGLQEWYPNRSFKPKASKTDAPNPTQDLDEAIARAQMAPVDVFS